MPGTVQSPGVTEINEMCFLSTVIALQCDRRMKAVPWELRGLVGLWGGEEGGEPGQLRKKWHLNRS